MARIELFQLTLEYPIYDIGGRSLKRAFLSLFGNKTAREKVRAYRVKALDNINIIMRPGDRVALIGRNGAGKSTLLRVLARVFEPTSGAARIDGRIGSLLSLGLGLYPDATGRENIVSQGLLLGATFAEVRARQREIEEFCDLGDALDRPTRTYSAGMVMRLCFAVSTAFDAQILLLDEVIGAGDMAFLKKARQRIDSLAANAEILVFASHDPSALSRFCNRGLVLDSGRVVYDAPIDDALNYYTSSVT